jgi:hypothetical protein
MTKIKINQNIISLGIYIMLCYSLKNRKDYVVYLGQLIDYIVIVLISSTEML